MYVNPSGNIFFAWSGKTWWYNKLKKYDDGDGILMKLHKVHIKGTRGQQKNDGRSFLLACSYCWF
jgi:hypothetical protein